MTEKMKTTAPVSSVGADGAQPQLKNYNEILYLIFDYPHKHYTFKYFEV